MTGWKLVPTEPDETMAAAAETWRMNSAPVLCCAIIAAAPEPGEDAVEAVATVLWERDNAGRFAVFESDVQLYREDARAILKLLVG